MSRMRLSGQTELIAAAGNVGPGTAVSLCWKYDEGQLHAFEYALNGRYRTGIITWYALEKLTDLKEYVMGEIGL